MYGEQKKGNKKVCFSLMIGERSKVNKIKQQHKSNGSTSRNVSLCNICTLSEHIKSACMSSEVFSKICTKL
jgi:hypothetical protein